MRLCAWVLGSLATHFKSVLSGIIVANIILISGSIILIIVTLALITNLVSVKTVLTGVLRKIDRQKN